MKTVALSEIDSNPWPVEEIYETEPKLDGVDVMQVTYDRDGPKIVVRFDLPEYPSNPPEKWAKQGFNRVQVQISLIGVRDVGHKGWAISNAASLSFAMDESGTKVARIDGQTTHFNATFDHLIIDKVSAYRNES
jgi:hypothetical protein